jgi:hypothetical protein
MKSLIYLSLIWLCSVTVSAQTNTGIGTTVPSSRLHVVGNGTKSPVRIDNMINTPINSNPKANLVIDQVTGELFNGTAASPPFYYLSYNLNNVNLDYVADFNTNISSTNYTLVIVGSTFDSYIGVSRNNPGITPADAIYDYFTAQNVYAFKSSGTWRISADYPNAATPNSKNGNWKINCLIISNNQVNTLSDITVNFNGSQNASGASPVQ